MGIDNINKYYDPKLKHDRLKELGILTVEENKFIESTKNSKLQIYEDGIG